MRIEEFDYALPRDRIAQEPPARRGHSRLMILDRGRGAWLHGEFRGLAQRLRRGDVLVRNDTKVMPARLRGRRAGGGGVEVLLLERQGSDSDGEVWRCLARPGRRLRAGARASFAERIEAVWLDDGGEEEIRRVRLVADRPLTEVLEEIGEVPLPPYIDRPPSDSDRAAYQTIYARCPGAVAAPTAGLHFTAEIFGELADTGVEVRDLTLHIGPATFLPVRHEIVEHHRLASEQVTISAETARAVQRAKEEGRRVVAVGTTTVRALEGALAEGFEPGNPTAVSLFITPGYRFRIVDALITNFHLPRSTLLMLVAAFAGRDFLLRAYREAIEKGYRFTSYGDAMLIF